MSPERLPEGLEVALGDRAYPIHIGGGLLDRAGEILGPLLPAPRAVLVTDSHVAATAHADRLEGSLRTAGIAVQRIVVPPGEGSKSFERLSWLVERILVGGVDRKTALVALGGGVIGDLAGFAAAITLRGLPFVQVPTSLLAQVDSSVGGKTGINTPQGKNLIGAFHQPSLVLADTDALSTLPAREMRAGYAEVAKYGLLGDAAFFDWLEKHWQSVFGNDPASLTEAIVVSITAKARIVERDETETGERMLLNLGHTFGHALEAWAGYSSRLLHGEAIAVGMTQAARFSEERGLCPAGTAARIERHLRSVGLPTRVAHIPGPDRPAPDALFALMQQDKKVQGGQLTLILLRGIGGRS